MESAGTCLLIVSSYHHNNTEKIAQAMAGVLDAEIRPPEAIDPDALLDCDLIGFGSGIYGAKAHPALLDLARQLSNAAGKRAFIFSTAALVNPNKTAKDHEALREILQSKGFDIVDEFSCRGFNTNSFIKYFGGMNKGRPNQIDLDRARAFASALLEKPLTS